MECKISLEHGKSVISPYREIRKIFHGHIAVFYRLFLYV